MGTYLSSQTCKLYFSCNSLSCLELTCSYCPQPAALVKLDKKWVFTIQAYSFYHCVHFQGNQWLKVRLDGALSNLFLLEMSLLIALGLDDPKRFFQPILSHDSVPHLTILKTNSQQKEVLYQQALTAGWCCCAFLREHHSWCRALGPSPAQQSLSCWFGRAAAASPGLFLVLLKGILHFHVLHWQSQAVFLVLMTILPVECAPTSKIALHGVWERAWSCVPAGTCEVGSRLRRKWRSGKQLHYHGGC